MTRGMEAIDSTASMKLKVFSLIALLSKNWEGTSHNNKNLM